MPNGLMERPSGAIAARSILFPTGHDLAGTGRHLPCGETDCGYGPLRAIRNLDLVTGNRGRGADAAVILTVIRRGYGPLWHPSATR
jgi:hypothetical protein